VVYHPNYNYYQNAPTIVYENTFAYRNYSGTLLIDQEQTLISNATIRLVPFAEDLSKSGSDTVTLSVQGGPEHAKTNTSESPVRVTIPSRLSATVWRNTILAGELDDPTDGVDEPHNYVTDVEPNTSVPNAVDIYLEANQTYTMGCRAVGANGYPPSGQASFRPGGYGTGSTQQYQEGSSETIASKGGILKGVINAESVNLTDPRFAATKASSGQQAETTRYLRFGFVLSNGTVGSADYRKYHIVVGGKEGMSYGVNQSGDIEAGSWSEHKVSIYRQDGTGMTKILDGVKLDQATLRAWTKQRQELGLLAPSNYKKPSTVEQDLQEVEDWLNNDDEVDLFVVEVHGRVDTTIK
jgi:hypothetical protein